MTPSSSPSTPSRSSSRTSARSAPVAKSWAHFLAGGIGGMTAAFVTSPLDVLKTRLQSDYYQAQLQASRAARRTPPPSALSVPRTIVLHLRETFQILFSIHRVEGWRALFKGLGPNLTGVVPARAINFYTYGNGKRVISNTFNHGHEAVWVHLCAAATAGIVTGTATNPIWLVKTRLQLDKNQAERRTSGPPGAAAGGRTATTAGGGAAAAGTVQQHRQYKNSVDCVRQVVRHEGIRGLYRGLSASYLGVTESSLQWVLYEQMKLALSRREQRRLLSGRTRTQWDHVLDWVGKLGAAGSAKLVAAAVTYPHEVVRTRLRQAPTISAGNDGRRVAKYHGLLQCFRLVWREEGVAGLYGGLTPHLLRVVPSAAIMFGMYEFILRVFGTES